MTRRRLFHLHLVSDATGETLNAVARAACAQYENVSAVEHSYALIRGPKQLGRVLGEIERPLRFSIWLWSMVWSSEPSEINATN